MRISSFFMRVSVVREILQPPLARWSTGGGRRRQTVLLLAGATGIVVGLAVLLVRTATFDWLADPMSRQPLWLQAAGPAVGLVVAWVALAVMTSKADTYSSATADEYVRRFHDPSSPRVDPSDVVGRTVASVGTVGYGGALGLEGPSLYLGGAIGAAVQRRFAHLFGREEAKLLLVAGAAAGISAIFKAPAAGALFAIEVPYRSDVARRVALPAMIGAAASYVTVALIDGAAPLLPMSGGAAEFDAVDLVGAVVVGLLCGLGARGFCFVLGQVMDRAGEMPRILRLVSAGAMLFGLVYVAEALFDAPLSLGTGYDVVAWTTDTSHSLWLVSALLAIRMLAVLAALGGGGAGGIFVPLLVSGALVGRLGGELPGLSDSNLWLVVGMAAFAGAGYRTPFAAVAFAAEATGQAGFLVPAMVATAAAQLLMGSASVSTTQQSGRLGRLDRRGEVPVSMVVETDVLTVPPDATLEELMSTHRVGRWKRAVPVVEGDSYRGVVVIEDVVRVRRDAWPRMQVSARTRADAPKGQVTWLVRDVLQAMEEADTDVVAVVDSADRFVGVVTTEGLLRLDEILELGSSREP